MHGDDRRRRPTTTDDDRRLLIVIDLSPSTGVIDLFSSSSFSFPHSFANRNTHEFHLPSIYIMPQYSMHVVFVPPGFPMTYSQLSPVLIQYFHTISSLYYDAWILSKALFYSIYIFVLIQYIHTIKNRYYDGRILLSLYRIVCNA